MLPLIGVRATISVIHLSRNLMPCHGVKGRRESENAGFHGGVTRRARTRRKVEGSRPARQEIGFVCEILRAESTSLTLRHLSYTRPATGLLSPAGSELVAIGWFGSLQGRYYSRASYACPPIHRSTGSCTTGKLPLTILQEDCPLEFASFAVDKDNGKENEMVTKRLYGVAAI